MNEETLLKQRKEKVVKFLKDSQILVIGILLIALILGIYIRSLPMQDHGGHPGLWDVTKNDWTLGPDLDPWLFTRYAKTILEKGDMPEIDTMRNVPLGFDTTKETLLLPDLIVFTHKLIISIVGPHSIEFSAALFPVIMFALTILSFFIFTREIFITEDKKSRFKANIIASIATLFMIVFPVFLPRTIAGIPEKESAAFFFMFLAFYFFLKAWKQTSIKKAAILAILSGITTGIMGLIWGGVSFVFVTLAITSLLAFFLNKIQEREFIIYSLWIVISFFVIVFFTERYTLFRLISSPDSTGISFLVFVVLSTHILIWHTKISQFKVFQNKKIPKNILSLIASIILIVVFISVVLGPSFLIEKIKDFYHLLFKPVTGRWNITVAENKQPYFVGWVGSFGPFIKTFPVTFWLFIIGSVVLFKKTLNYLRKKDSWILTGLYAFFLIGMVFSRYSPNSIFNGENFISKTFYFGSAILFVWILIKTYILYEKEGHKGFQKINYNFILALSLFVLALFAARSAVRLVMVLGPISSIILGYVIIEPIFQLKKTKDETWRVFLIALIGLILILSIFSFFVFYKSIKAQSYNMVPSYYNKQWQYAMKWVRDETPKNAVFGHWWDYGYWLQSIGERPTVLDGGNAISFWNYWMGRLVLTGDNQKDALDFLYSHNTSYFLIDSSDIGKYGAFSSIGSNENYDRYSWIPSMVSDPRQTRETANGTIRVYQGGSATDEDIYYEKDGKKIFLPGQKTALIGIIVKTNKKNNSITFEQPTAVFYYQGIKHEIPLRYVEYRNSFYDFKSGLNGTIKFIPSINPVGNRMNIDEIGALIYISPRVMRGFFAQKYLLNDPFDKFPNFKIAHIEQNLIIKDLNNQGLNLPDFIYYHGIQGPIKIWKIEYTGNEKVQQKYLDKDSSKYLNWEL